MIRKRKKTHTMYNKGLFDDTNGTGYNRKMKRKRTPAERGRHRGQRSSDPDTRHPARSGRAAAAGTYQANQAGAAVCTR